MVRPQRAVSSGCALSAIIAHTCNLPLHDRSLRWDCTCGPFIDLFLSSWMPLTYFCSSTPVLTVKKCVGQSRHLPSLLHARSPMASQGQVWFNTYHRARIHASGSGFRHPACRGAGLDDMFMSFDLPPCVASFCTSRCTFVSHLIATYDVCFVSIQLLHSIIT